MANISDMIEQFILDNFVDNYSDLSRNELANFFGVSPSQINYVLATRFTFAKGFVTESKRGGGGYIRISRVEEDDFIKDVLTSILDRPIDVMTGNQILDNLLHHELISEKENKLLKKTISSKALKMPIDYEDELRTKIVRNILMGLMED